MTTTQHLQSVLLMMMKDIDTFCKENDIEYFLYGGSSLGAIRHKGFIPWDDDLDIIMDNVNYEKFMSLCRTKLNPEKYYLQEGLKDWTVYFSKVRLKGTRFIEEVNPITDPEKQGIFIDIFRMDNIPNNYFLRLRQYLYGKLLLSYQLASRSGGGYTSSSFLKRASLIVSSSLRWKPLRDYLMSQVLKYNKHPERCTDYGVFFDRTNLKNYKASKSIIGKPTYVPFEDTMMPVQQNYHEYLTILFGDYMTPPPAHMQVGDHMTEIDFGEY